MAKIKIEIDFENLDQFNRHLKAVRDSVCAHQQKEATNVAVDSSKSSHSFHIVGNLSNGKAS